MSKPDKGRGIVILNKDDYVRKVDNVLNLGNTFRSEPTNDPLKHTLLVEDRINRFLRSLLNKGSVSEFEYKQLYARGCRPGLLYGLPKVHKEGCPIRPVLYAIKTPGYNVSKFAASLIASYASNEYTLLNSMELVDSIKGFNFKEGMVMTSFDIESLYTNVPVKETIELLVNHIYDTEGTSVRNMKKKTFKDLLNIATSNSFFVFNNKYYNQTEGLAMGQPLSAPLANIFLCLKEKQ